VRDGDVASAVEHLRAAIAHGTLALDFPLSIAPAIAVTALAGDAPTTTPQGGEGDECSVVLAPTDLAVVRRDAGERALERRQDAIERHDATIHDNQRDQRGYEALA